MEPNDAAAAWEDTYQRVRDLVAGVDPQRMEERVPACPDWTARDLLSHVIGLDADSMAGDEPDDHNATWTQRQVDARADHSVEQLLAEWAEIAETLPTWMREVSVRPLGDVVIHEQDLRGALGEPGGRDSVGLRMIRDRMVGRFAGNVEALPPIALLGETWRWVSHGESDAAEVVVEAPDFDLFRAITSRRTEAQLRGWTMRGDVTPYLAAFAALGPAPDRPLPE